MGHVLELVSGSEMWVISDDFPNPDLLDFILIFLKNITSLHEILGSLAWNDTVRLNSPYCALETAFVEA